ncbi:MAG: outer membrane beta-barrel protein [Desulfobacterales bacterium]|jgi:hypothetical protein|nr:outer membrane beta-barrel protein [Desulfobacterales bacterium]
MKLRVCLCVFAVFFCCIGSVAIGSVLEITPRVTISESYTDNASLTENNAESDFVTTISPSVNMAYSEKHASVRVFYDYEYEIFESETENNSETHNAGLTGWADISKNTRLQIAQTFSRIEDPLRERDQILFPEENIIITPDTILRRSREPYYTYNSSIDLQHQFGERDYINFSYIFGLREDKSEDGNNYKRHTPGVSVSYWLTPQYGMDASVEYTRAMYDENNTSVNTDDFNNSDDFDDVSSNVSFYRKLTRHLDAYLSYGHTVRMYKGDSVETESDYQIYSPSVGVSYQPDKNTSVRLGVGYFYQDLETEEDEEGPFCDANITRNWQFPRGTFSLTGSSGIDRNEFGSENRGFERYYDLIGALSYGLTKHLSSTLSASIRRNEYINDDEDLVDNRLITSAGLIYTPSRRLTTSANYTYSMLLSESDDANDKSGPEDDQSSFNWDLTYTARPWLFLGLGYSYRDLNSNDSGRSAYTLNDENHTENRIFISVTVTPERPYRKIF